MFFLLRTAFWLTIVLALIPLGTPQAEDTSNQPGVDPVSAFMAAQETVSDIGGFCSRNPKACETGGQAIAAIGSQAAEGAGIVLGYLDRTFFDGEDRSAPAVATEGGPQVLPAPEVADNTALSNGASPALVTGSVVSTPDAAASAAGTLTASDRALPWTDGASTPQAVSTQAAQGAPIGPLPRPNPRAGFSGRGANLQPDSV